MHRSNLNAVLNKLVLNLVALFIMFLSADLIAQEDLLKRGDNLHYAELSMPQNLLPIYGMDEKVSNRVIGFFYNGLIKITETLEIVNDLAVNRESIMLNDGREKIIVTLKPDIKFHDGSTVTAEDVVFSYDIILNPINPTAQRTYLANLDKVEKVDQDKVGFIFKQRNPSNAYLLRFPILPAHSFDDDINIPLLPETDKQKAFSTKPIGTGPFLWQFAAPGQAIIFTGHNEYFNRPPFLGGITLHIRSDAESIVQEIETEAIDFLPSIEVYHVGRLQSNPSVTVKEYPTFNYTSMVMNCGHRFLQEVDVRKAIDYGISKMHIVEAVFIGFATRISGPYAPTSWANNVSIRLRDYDIAQAKTLLKEAGFSDSNNDGIVERDGYEFSVKLKYERGLKSHEEVATIIQEELGKIGIEVTLEPKDKSILYQECQYEHNYDMALFGWEFGVDPDRYDLFHSSQTEKGLQNFALYKNKEVDGLLQDGRSCNHFDTRQNTYYDVHRIIFEEVPHIFLYSQKANAAIHCRFHDYEINALSVFNNICNWYCDPKLR
ncbi:MAG: ABC transporter substrate-binding protein [Candidatus Hatepunaea meridiana]|nr:ABC transporter substrate-binding protein [Candidatus Hatepunaea meridiana]